MAFRGRGENFRQVWHTCAIFSYYATWLLSVLYCSMIVIAVMVTQNTVSLKSEEEWKLALSARGVKLLLIKSNSVKLFNKNVIAVSERRETNAPNKNKSCLKRNSSDGGASANNSDTETFVIPPPTPVLKTHSTAVSEEIASTKSKFSSSGKE